MIWPVFGIIPSIVFHLSDAYNWGTIVLIKAGGTIHYRGMWMGGAYGIATTDPSNIEYMLKTNFQNFPKGNYYGERFRDLLGDGIFIANDKSWMEQRQLEKHEMHSSHFIDLLLLFLFYCLSSNSFDLQEVLIRFTFDNISTIALVVNPRCLALDLPEVPFAKAFEEATELTLLRFLMPPFVWKSLKFFGLGNERQLKEAIKVVHDFADKKVRDRRKILGNLSNQSDLLSRLIESENKQGQNRHFQMVYLQAALSESLRLYPSVPIELKEVLEDDVLPDGTRLKKGAQVFNFLFSMVRMESIWGKDCLEFKLERQIKDGKFVSANQFKYPVFNAGPRRCLGKNFSYTQMKMVAVSVLLR
ncbi:hypothetical protein Gotur_007730 [Gossypium turneri]